jgi:hypothetical protein
MRWNDQSFSIASSGVIPLDVGQMYMYLYYGKQKMAASVLSRDIAISCRYLSFKYPHNPCSQTCLWCLLTTHCLCYVPTVVRSNTNVTIDQSYKLIAKSLMNFMPWYEKMRIDTFSCDSLRFDAVGFQVTWFLTIWLPAQIRWITYQ